MTCLPGFVGNQPVSTIGRVWWQASEPAFTAVHAADNVADDAQAAAKAPKGAMTEAKSSFNYGKKIQGQAGKRGWSDSMIDETISQPHATSTATNKATGGNATADFRKDGSYVVWDNASGEII